MKIFTTLLMFVTFLFSSEITLYLDKLKTVAKSENIKFKDFDAKRGEKIFFTKKIGKRGEKVSCASCHTDNLKNSGENVFTGKKILPLAPSVNRERITKVKKVKKWLRRNFRDVYKREGTAQEKGDVLLYILNQ